jgi:hypothetical protein
MGKRALLVVGWCMAMLAAACTNEGPENASGTPLPPTPTATSPSPTGRPSASPSLVLEDGRHFGYIRSAQLTAEPQVIVFDLAYLLTGDEANQAAAERGKETPVPNDYFIVNDNPRLRELPVAPGLRILLLDWTDCCDTMFRADPQLFQESFDQERYPPGNYKGTFSGYWLTVRGGAVTKVEEQYFP